MLVNRYIIFWFKLIFGKKLYDIPATSLLMMNTADFLRNFKVEK